MVFCNKSEAPIEAAFGYRDTDADGSDSWISEGWWRIEPAQCARVYNKPLTQRFYFYYATALTVPNNGDTPQSWSGKYEFCTDTQAFKIEGDGNCAGRGYQTRGYQQIDIGANTRDYSLDFRSKR